MADAFLHEIFHAENRVQADEQQDCIICLEKCGTMNPRSGLTEFAIRLPSCHHIVGSGCIATWLHHQNNTCPLCRHVFFSTSSDLHDDHDIDDHAPSVSRPRRQRGLLEISPTSRREIMSGPLDGIMHYLTRLRHLCDSYCAQLRLQPDAARIVASIAANLVDPKLPDAAIQTHSDKEVVAVSIHVFGILTRHQKSPEEISGVIEDVDGQFIENYGDLADWKEVIDGDIRYQLSETFGIKRRHLGHLTRRS